MSVSATIGGLWPDGAGDRWDVRAALPIAGHINLQYRSEVVEGETEFLELIERFIQGL
jgi:hypothetical protein